MDYKHIYINYKSKYLELKNTQIGGDNKSDNYLDGIKIIKPLGKGMHGTVYLVEDEKTKKKYAMKVEQVFKKDMKESTKSPLWREIDFANTLSKKYQNQFMQIYKYENKKCNYVHEFDDDKWKSIQKNQVKYYKKLFASPYCSIKLTSIVDDMLHNIIYKLDDKNVILDLFIQVVYISYLINKEGYYHRDFHPKNIGVVFTKDKYITILGKKVETHGYLLQAIDYGMVLHKKYELENWEKSGLKYDNDLYQNFYKIVFKIMIKNMINKYPDKNINEKVSISKEDNKVLDNYLKNIKVDNSKWVVDNYAYFQELLYKILFFDKFQDQLKIKNKVELFTFIPIRSVIYIVENFYELEKILHHLIKIRNKQSGGENILKIDHVMFPVYNNNNFLEEVANEYKKNDKYVYNIGNQEKLYKGIYLYGKSFYVEHLSTIKGETYWSNSLAIILDKKYWSYYKNPDMIDDNFMIPKFGCGYFFVNPNYPYTNDKKNKSDYDNFIIYISNELEYELKNIGGISWTLPKYIKVDNNLKHKYDIVVKDDDVIIGSLFQSNFPGFELGENNLEDEKKKYVIKLDTYDDYLEFAKKNIGKDCQWIYDIIDKKSGLDRLLYENKNFVLVIEMNMKQNDMTTFHLLAFPKDKSIKSIRDLTKDHIPLLKDMVSESKKYIIDKYGLKENEIEAHFHYPPGVLLLHIHFEWINNERLRRPLREHSVNKVIENLLIDPEYYKKIRLDIIKKI